MSATSVAARAAAKAKVQRLTRASKGESVDASDFTAQDAQDANAPTGMRPVSPRAYKRGGKVDGEQSVQHAGRKPRKTGGRLGDEYENRDLKEANEQRPGVNFVGGYKAGGKVHGGECKCEKCSGGRVGKKAGGAINDGTRPAGGRLARKGGGRANKKGMNVNIIIAQPKSATALPMGMPPPGMGPVGLHQGAPPPAMPPAGAAAPMGPPPMPMGRKAGGKVSLGKYPIDSGAGGGLGRREKARAYG